jgi:hypothetical protein
MAPKSIGQDVFDASAYMMVAWGIEADIGELAQSECDQRIVELIGSHRKLYVDDFLQQLRRRQRLNPMEAKGSEGS